MHGKTAEVNATALNTLLTVESKAVMVEERSRGKTGVRGDSRDVSRAQRRLDTIVKFTGDTPTSKFGMSEEKVQVAIEGIRGETCDRAVRLGDDRMKPRQALLPSCGIAWDRRPRGKLLGRIIRRRQRAD